MPENLVQCYNRGCGQLYDPNTNDSDVCCHHPGFPVFHDAYKGWSCCNKKSVDFTEFLNIKGCTYSKHSHVKPEEPVKKSVDKELDKKEVIEVRAPIVGPQLPRPPFETSLVTLEATVADSLKQANPNASQQVLSSNTGIIEIGTTCKNGGCNTAYNGPQTNDSPCIFHPGCPVAAAGTVKCRWDWHQTPDYVIVSVYAKKYDPIASFVKINPIRLNLKIVFKEENNASFKLDLELRGVIDVSQSSASMLGTKVEIKLKKAEPGAWSKIDFPRVSTPVVEEPEPEPESNVEDDSVDLSAVEAIHSSGKVNLTG
ncbi:unnamed protein product [Leptidea sinapis]|uniref:Cysteine and histidine-rich domain-containing protein n=1 Tax=Leptidea sinapis TaxID=189913 RepID=A0A5E4PV05_9NEOP|nr:unnamed protein product [Leptidea sinapis]